MYVKLLGVLLKKERQWKQKLDIEAWLRQGGFNDGKTIAYVCAAETGSEKSKNTERETENRRSP